jgi:hypothetical protein
VSNSDNAHRTSEAKVGCQHRKSHEAIVAVQCFEDTGTFLAEIRIKCADCGLPFQFLNLPLGLHMGGSAMSVDGQEARLAIVPVGQTPHPLKGLVSFGVKAS